VTYSTPGPGVDCRRGRLPDACAVDARERRQRAELRTERDPFIRLSHDSRLASDGIAQDGETIARADDEGIEAIEIVERVLERPL